jgi:hypothetical protein
VPTTTWIGERVCPTCRGTERSPYANNPGDCPTCAGRGQLEVPLAPAPSSAQVPLPVLTGLAPATAARNTKLTVTFNGSNFAKTSACYFNDKPVPTTYVSPTQMTAVVDLAGLAAGTYPATVRSLSGRSAQQTFTVT